MDFPIARYHMEANGETIILYIGMYLVQEVHTSGMHTSWDVDRTF